LDLITSQSNNAEDYKRPDFNEMLGKVWDLLAGYNVQKIYIDDRSSKV
jgi:hypothetical protein